MYVHRTCDPERGLRIKTTDAPVVFTAKGAVLLASKQSVSKRSEHTKQVTETELARHMKVPSPTK